MGLRPHYLFDVLVGSCAILLLGFLFVIAGNIRNDLRRICTRVGLAVAVIVVAMGIALSPLRISTRMPASFVQWTKASALLISVFALYSAPVIAVIRSTAARMPERRQMLQTAAAAAIAIPATVVGAAIIKRDELVLREVDIRVPGLPPDLDGLKIVQLSDIHLSAFVNEKLLARAVGMANETKAHIAIVTGDLISLRGDPLDECLDQLRGLRSDAGTFGCLGNHEIYANAEAYTAYEGAKRGMRFLRYRSEVLPFGAAKLNLVGVDHQRMGTGYLPGVEKLVVPGMTNVLLSHNPDVFPVAARKGFDLTLAGHTHGGQVNFEILERHVSIARFFTPYVYGRYEMGGKSAYVTRGIGTVGVPARLGAPPEVALIRLCAS